MGRRWIVLNILLFQLGWFGAVYGAANQMPWLGIVVIVPILLWHLARAQHWHLELKLMLLLGAVGCVLDQTLLSLHLLSFPASDWPAHLLPAWMVALWLLFATTLNVSMRWIKGHYLIGLVFGAVGGVLAYLGGEKLGGITLHSSWTLLAIGVNWAMAMPLAIYFSIRFDGCAGSKT